ncbi:MAG: hypothetical protein HYY49_09360 [Ignavibacteriales bacterium]|nr:hypothetical protein [Ignavibacteriales bacterium]
MTQAQTAATGYEFTDAQNMTFGVLASRMKFLGILNMVFAVCIGLFAILALFSSPLTIVVSGPQVAMFIVLGLWMMNASSSFRMIVETHGQDISHLMTAMESLRKLYNLQFWLTIAVLVVFVIGFLFALSMGVFAAAAMNGEAT